jgi:hypothetical protein
MPFQRGCRADIRKPTKKLVINNRFVSLKPP